VPFPSGPWYNYYMSEMEKAWRAVQESSLSSYMDQVKTQVRRMNTTAFGVPQNVGGVCSRCQTNRSVIWVEELEGFRCSTCLRGRFGNPVGRPPRPVEEE
jgi:hypothetical protein